MAMALSENKQKMLRGELYHAFTPELIRERRRCSHACNIFNNAGDVPRRRLVELWKDIIGDKRSLPPQSPDPEEDEALLVDESWVEPPVHIDYGTNIRLAPKVYINFNSTFLDTCPITIGSRTIVGPNVSFFSGTHPLDPELRNGTAGPELGGDIHIEEDVWIGGNAIFLPGVRIGRGATVGAGSVVTKDVPPFSVAAGNPARIIRKLESSLDPSCKAQPTTGDKSSIITGAEKPMAEFAESLEHNETR
ncbi:hypothetical protein MMC20_000076 [Loxospora ochrophaea]|nr:hypothetical protein [Loxospora ochrophaea]